MGRKWAMGQSLRMDLDYFTLQILKVLIATFVTLRNKLKNGKNFKEQKWCLPINKYCFV